MRRRTVAAAVLIATMTTALAACDGGGQPVGATTAATPPTGCSGVAMSEVDVASVLVAGPVNDVPPSDAKGEKLIIVAAVLDSMCSPARGANVRLWHTDARGRYGPAGDDCCYYGGTVRTDANGLFRVETIRPGQYPEPGAPPAHIHVEIEHPSATLRTEIVFELGQIGAGTVPVTLRSVDDAAGRYWYGETAFVLGG
jgi:protocatechuate 3,4-dioxygenase beta subunit